MVEQHEQPDVMVGLHEEQGPFCSDRSGSFS